MDNKARIVIDHVSKLFTRSSVSELRNLVAIFSKNGLKKFKAKEVIQALKEVSFTLEEGERVGIIGRNGAGKTTLLNLIGGFSEPTSGTVTVNGKVHAIMSMGTAIREDLTGRENIYLEGELQNKSRVEIDRKMKEITEFADIDEFIDRPVKNYSSGMKARLAFSLLLFIEPEILIIDEVLGVGDHAFASKSAELIRQLCEKGKILIIVSHDIASINQLTDRAIWLEDGRVIKDGPSREVTQYYFDCVSQQEEERLQQIFRSRLEKSNFSDGAEIISIGFSVEGQNQYIFNLYDDVILKCAVRCHNPADDWDISISLLRMDGNLLQKRYASEDGVVLPKLNSGDVCTVTTDIEKIAFADGIYEVVCEVNNRNKTLARRSAIIKIHNTVEKALSKPDYYCQYKIISG